VSQIRVYLIPDKTGYAAGTGGTIRVTLNTDDGTSSHRPSSSVLGTHWITNILSLPSPARYFYTVKFFTATWITAGRIYHLVFKNEDKYPTYNYLSVDDLYHVKPTSPSQPTTSDTSLAVLMSAEGGPWYERPGYTPIYELDFTNGNYQGVGYMEAWVGAPRTITGVHAVRETFTVSSNVNVSTAAIRLSRIYGTAPPSRTPGKRQWHARPPGFNPGCEHSSDERGLARLDQTFLWCILYAAGGPYLSSRF
jgi:hypothetical protein